MTSTSFRESFRVYTLMALTFLSALLISCSRRIRTGTMWFIGGPCADLALSLHRLMLRCRKQPISSEGATCVTPPVSEPAGS